MSMAKFLAMYVVFLVLLLSVLSRYAHVNVNGAGASECIFGTAVLFGLVGVVVLLIGRK